MLDFIQEFAKNLSAEAMGLQPNARDLVGGTVAMTIIDNTSLIGLIDTASKSIPVGDAQRGTISAGLTYMCARVVCRAGEKSLGF